MLEQGAGEMAEAAVTANTLNQVKNSERLRHSNCLKHGEIDIKRNDLASIAKPYQRRRDALRTLDGIQLVCAEIGASMQDRDVVCHYVSGRPDACFRES